MEFCDSHCHLFSDYYPSIEDVFNEAILNDVTHFIVSGCDSKSNHEVLRIIHRPNCFGVVGLHPDQADVYQKEDIAFLIASFNYPSILGIGEIGLDYHYTKENRQQQIKLFEEQLKLAEKFHLPVVIHSRDATMDTINILKKYQVKGIIHSFSGSLEVAKSYIQMGFKLGINGVITFKNCKLKDILPEIFPYIVLETDSPFLTPHPYRGTQNSPKYIRHIAEFIATELNISINQVEKVTNENLRSIFDKYK